LSRIGNMSARRTNPSSRQADSSRSRGCLPGIFLPPLGALLLSGLTIWMAFGLITPVTSAPVEDRLLEEKPLGGNYGMISPVFTAEVQYWGERIVTWAERAGVDPNLAATVMQIESCGDPQALSRSGAIGLFQVMPYHFASSEDPFSPDTNALRGMDYLARSLRAASGEARLALAGYNGGIGVIGWAEADWPLQTVNYARWGSGIYREASSGGRESETLQDWLQANGLWLCRQAAGSLGINP